MPSLQATPVDYGKVLLTVDAPFKWDAYHLSYSPTSYPWHVDRSSPDMPTSHPDKGDMSLPVFVPPGSAFRAVVDTHQGTDAYFSLWGLREDRWTLVGRAVCSVPEDLGSTRTLISAIPNTVHTGGDTYGVREDDTTISALLSSLGLFFDSIKSDLHRMADHPSLYPNRILNHTLESLGGFSLSDPGAARRMLPVLRSAAVRKGTAEALEEVLSALVGVVVQIPRTTSGDVAVDNMVLCSQDSNPGTQVTGLYDFLVDDPEVEADDNSQHLRPSSLMSMGLWAETEEIEQGRAPVEFTGPRPPLVSHAWVLEPRPDSEIPHVFGSRIKALASGRDNLPFLIPVEPGGTYTFSVYNIGEVTLGLRWYRADGSWIAPTILSASEPSGDQPTDGEDIIFIDGPGSAVESQLRNTFEADYQSWSSSSQVVAHGWSRSHVTMEAPSNARFLSWHVLVTMPSTKLWGAQVTKTPAPVTYRDPRSFTAHANPKRTNLAPGGGCSDTLGWSQTSGTGPYTLSLGGNHSSLCLNLPAGTHNYPVSGTTPTVSVRSYASASLDLRAASGNATATVQIQGCPATTVSLTDQWKRVSVSGLPPESNGSRPVAIVITSGSALMADNVLIESGSSTSGPFFDGNSPGGVWSGAADASSSGFFPGPRYLRQAADVLVDEWSPMQVRGSLVLVGDPVRGELPYVPDLGGSADSDDTLVDDAVAEVGGLITTLVDDATEMVSGSSEA